MDHLKETTLRAFPGFSEAATELAKECDPVCGMKVDPATSKFHTEHGGKTYCFCSAGGQEKFAGDPVRYLKSKTQTPPLPVSGGVIYTCPMHPQIRDDHPGTCPICGMALEPLA